MLLEGKSAIITGAGSGVGRASALRFAEEGAAVVCADIDLDRAKETVALIEAAGGWPSPSGVTSAEDADVRCLIASAVGHFGRLDIMFNNVGIPTPRLGMIFEDHSVEDFERLTAVNFRGVFLGCKHAVIQFKEQGDGGVILNTGIGRRPRRLGRHGLRRHQGSGAPAHPGRRRRGGARSASGSTPSARPACPTPASWRPAGWPSRAPTSRQWPPHTGSMHPLGRPITAEDCAEAAVYLVLRPGRPTSPGSCCPSTAGTSPNDGTAAAPRPRAGPPALRPGSSVQRLERRRLHARTPTRSGTSSARQAPVHEGTVHGSVGC